MMLTRNIIDEIPEEIYNCLDKLGVPPHIKGYDYTAYGIKLLLENPNKIHAITKELYPGIAEAFGTTASRVERAIRHSIDCLLNTGDHSEISKLFINYMSYRPNNGHYLATIMRHVRKSLMNNKDEIDSE